MKWLSATAVFAAVLPSITVFGEPLSKELNSSYRGSGLSASDSASKNFTQQTQDDSGTTYTITGDVSFRNFTNIPDPKPRTVEPDPAPAPAPDTQSNTVSSKPKSESKPSLSTGYENTVTQPQETLYHGPDDLHVTSFASHVVEGNQAISDIGKFADEKSHPLSFSLSSSSHAVSTSTTDASTSTPAPKGGGAFYNDKAGPITFITHAGNPGSLSCTLIRMTGQGGAIYSKGPISFDGLENLTFRDDLSQQAGGALFTDSTLTIRNILDSIEFTNNSARVPIPLVPVLPAKSAPGAGVGGLVPPKLKETHLLPRYFSQEIKVQDAESQTSIFPTYTTETAGNGGAIFAKGAIVISTYKDMTFRSNSAEFPLIIDVIKEQIDAQKKATSLPSASEKIHASADVAKQQVREAPPVIKGSGGAIFGLDTITIRDGSEDTLFILNTATGAGGAIYGDKDISLNNIANLRFQSNSADTRGGAIYAKGNLTIQDSTVLTQFNANSGKTGGGAIYCLGNVTLSNLSQVRFGVNKAGNYDLKITIPGKEASTAHVLSSVVEEQKAPVPIEPPLGKGGGIYVEKAFTVSHVTSILEFINNQATDHGGGAYVKGALNCSNSHRIQFTTNTSKKSGGGLYCESDVTFSNLTGKTLFQGNKAEENGGGICLADTKSLTLSNLENFCLVNNTTSKSGGGAYIPKALSFTFSNPDTVSSTTPATVPVFGSAVITGNKAEENGGGVYTTKAALTNLESIDIGQNSAKNGAGLCTTSAPAAGVAAIGEEELDFKVDYVVTANVTKNNATESGGGVYGKKGKISRLDHLNITGNSAGKSGGGLYFTEKLTLEGIEISKISDNTAKESGGAIYAKALTCTNFPDGLTVSNNKAQVTSTTTSSPQKASVPTAITGGAFSAETLILEKLQGNCTFSGNAAIDNNTASLSSDPTDPNIQGGALYAKTSLTLQNSSGSLTFSGNSATTKRSSTTGQVAGGAIYSPTVTIQNCSQPISFVGNSALCTPAEQPPAEDPAPKATFGGAIAGTTSITFTGNQALFFKENSADNGSAIGCKNGSNGTVTFSDAVFCSFEGNIAKNRGTIYADTLSIPQGYMNFSNNSSANDGSAIYFTKKADITAAASILFLDNKVTLAQTSDKQRSQVNNLGAAIYGEGNSTDAELNLTALGGSITFKNNQCAPQGKKSNPSFCSITGKVKLTLNAAANQSINFYDAVRTQTVQSSGSNYTTLDINKTSSEGNPPKYTGTVLFSSEYHENKSVIPQKVVLHDGTLILGKNTELNVVSFDQKAGSSLVMGPGAVLSTQQKTGGSSGATGGIAINNLTIDFSDIVSEDGTATPPALKLGVAPAAAAAGARAHVARNNVLPRADVSNPDVTKEKVYLTGTITLIDPAGTFYQNPYLGEDRQIELLTLPESGKVEISDLTLEGDTKPLKGYIGSWTLGPGDQNGTLKANWKFEEYRRWIYIPRDNYFYVNSILGSQNSLIAVKQGIVNNMLNNARFDDAAYNNLWLCGIGSFLQKEQGEESRSFSYHSRGYSLAIDAKPRPEFILGASFSQVFGHSKSEKAVDNYKHKGSDHSFQGTLYAGKSFYLPYRRTQSPQPILLQGVMTYGYMKHDTTTYYPSIHERNLGNWEDLGWLFDIRMILDLKEPSQNSTTRFSFYSEAEYTGVRQKQFTELDYDPRTFDSFAYRNLSIPLGFVFEGALMQYNILMYNKLSLAYVPVIYRNKPKCNYRVNSTGQTGQVYGVIPTRNTGRVEYSSQLYLGSYWTLYGTYTVEAGMSSLVQMANCGARMIF